MALRTRLTTTGPALLMAAAVAFSTTVSSDATACGGLFCSNSNPVNQAAERIVFSKNDDGTVTAAIEILYQGPSMEFAWVLPVPAAEVSVAVSSKQAFDALQQASNPVYSLQTTFEEGCQVPVATSPGSAPSAGGDFASEADDGAAPAVEVVASGNAGPYDYTQIALNPDLEDPAQAAVDWLTENGYDVTSVGPDLLRPYLEEGMNLLGFKLSKGNDSGSIRPVLLNYPGERPTIPIRPTAVAANQDMGVMVWVLGNGRAVPTNYLHLELNEAHINWFNPGPSYNDVIIAAADEAGGQGFVTEQAGPAGDFSESVFPTYKEDQWTQLRTAQFGSIQEFLSMAQNVAVAPVVNFTGGFGGPLGGDAAFAGQQPQYDGFLDVLSDPDIVPLREGATPAQLNACMSCYFQQDVAVRNDLYPSTDYDPETDPILDMDVQAFLGAMEDLVIEPLRATRGMFEENSHVTRFYTTLSADEMTMDPDFDLNPELPDFPNTHIAERVMLCSEDATTEWRIELPQGMVLEGDGNTWPVPLDDPTMPFNFRVLQLSTVGMGDVVVDNTDVIVDRLVDLGVGEAGPNMELGDDPDDPNSVGIGNPDEVDDPVGDPDDPMTSDRGDPDDDDPTGTGSDSDPELDEDPDDRSVDDEGDDTDLEEEMSGPKGDSGGCAIKAPASHRSGGLALLGAGLLGLVGVRRRRSRTAR